jgi:hypothetical protein
MHDLVFWGGVTAPSYDPNQNKIQPSVDWAVVDKVKLARSEALNNIVKYYSYGGYANLKAEYKKMMTAAEFEQIKFQVEQKSARKSDKMRRHQQEEDQAERQALLQLPKDQLMQKVAAKYYWRDYTEVHPDFRAVISEAEFNSAVAAYKEQAEAQEKARAKQHKRELLAMPKDKMLGELTRFGDESYDQLDPDYKKIITRSEFDAARAKQNELYEASRKWH